MLTETTWEAAGGRLRGRLCVCLLAPVGEGRAGGSLIYGKLSAWQPSTLGWLKDTDGPLPHSVGVSGALAEPAVWSQWCRPACVTQTRANKEVFLNHKSYFVIFVRDVNSRAQKGFPFIYLFFFIFLSSFPFALNRHSRVLPPQLFIYLPFPTSGLHHSYNNGNFQMRLPSPVISPPTPP